jgi:hypothetical protein
LDSLQARNRGEGAGGSTRDVVLVMKAQGK